MPPENNVPKTCDIEKQHEGLCSNGSQEKKSAFSSLGLLDRFLAVWIFLAMAIGIILGNFVPNTGPALQKGTFVGVSIPIGALYFYLHDLDLSTLTCPSSAVGLLVMMYPILCKVRFESLHHVFQTKDIWIQMAFSIFLNWIIAPFLMVCQPPSMDITANPLLTPFSLVLVGTSLGFPTRRTRITRRTNRSRSGTMHRNGKFPNFPAESNPTNTNCIY
jgi:phosphatidylserine synthase